MINNRVLILNVSYEPLGTMSVQRAMCKISRTDSTLQVLEWASRTLKTTKGEYPVPSVLRLTYYINILKKRNDSGAKRYKIYMRDQFRCGYCGVKVGKPHSTLKRKLTQDDLTLDHIKPVSQDGKTTPDNLVTACKPCNQLKRDRTPEEANMPLLTPKTLLRAHLDSILISEYASRNPQWQKYLYSHSSEDTRYAHKEA